MKNVTAMLHLGNFYRKIFRLNKLSKGVKLSILEVGKTAQKELPDWALACKKKTKLNTINKVVSKIKGRLFILENYLGLKLVILLSYR